MAPRWILRARLGSQNPKNTKAKRSKDRREPLQIFQMTPLEQRILFGAYPAFNLDELPIPTVPCSTSCNCDTPTVNNGPGNGEGGPGSANSPGGTGGPGKSAGSGGSSSGMGGAQGPTLISETIAPTGAATTEAPIQDFDGMPLIQNADLQSQVMGLTWGVTRAWTGLNNTGPMGNGWSVAELPYLVVGGGIEFSTTPGGPLWTPGSAPAGTYPDDHISMVEGASAYTFSIPTPNSDPNEYNTYAPWGGQHLSLQRVQQGSNYVMQMTDAAGDVTDFYDLYRQPDPNTNNPRPVPYSRALSPSMLYGDFKSFTAANGTSVNANYNGSGQLTSEVITNPNTGRSEQFIYSYTPTSGTGAVTNSAVTNAGGTVPQLVSNVVWQEQASPSSQWQTVETAAYVYYNGDGTDNAGHTVNVNDGRLGDLEVATTTDASGNIINQDYYRYYKLTGESDNISSQGPTNQSATTGGPAPLEPSFAGAYNPNSPSPLDSFVMTGLKTVVTGASFDRMAANVSGYLTASDATIQPYVNNFFNYERWTDHVGAEGGISGDAAAYNVGAPFSFRDGYRFGSRYRVVQEIAQAAGCSTCSGGQGTFKYEYAANLDNSDNAIGYGIIDYNEWRMKTTTYLPDDTSSTWADNNREVVYTNEVGQPLLDIFVQLGTTTASITGVSVTNNSNNATVTVTATNTFQAGQTVAISGILPELYNGVFTIVSANSSSFTFNIPETYYGSTGAPTPYVNTTTPSPGSVNLGPGGATIVTGQWATYYRYDDEGRLIQVAQPSAVGGWNDAQGVNVGVSPAISTGLITDYQYTGWSFDGRAGVTGNPGSGTVILPSGSANAPQGNDAAFFEDTSVISQTIAGWTAGTYTLSFQAAGAFNANMPFQVFVDGAVLTFGGQNTVDPGPTYSSYTSASFNVSTGVHTIRFVGSGGGSGASLLDEVAINGTNAPSVADSGFEAANLAAGSYQFNPQFTAITATSSAAGAVTGTENAVYIQQGEQGTLIPQQSFTYFADTANSATVFPLASSTVYGNADGTDPRTTLFNYTFFSGTDQIQSLTITDPPIVAAQNGPATSDTDTADADTTTDFFDSFGNLQWQKDGGGFLTYNQFDPLTGGLLKNIQDVNTNDTGDFTNLPSGWTTPSGGGLELITTCQVDALGRCVEETSPNGNTTYTVYSDGHPTSGGGFVNQVRIYPGWHEIGQTGTYTTTGPVQITREYRPAAGAPSGQQTVYDETLTITAPVESTSTPSGAESISASNIQSLSRDLTSDGGQMIETDAYFSLGGVSYSAASAQLGSSSNNSASGNYHATLFGYDNQGLLDRVQEPTGTIYRTVHDGLGRVTSRWVGTDDTPSSGFWSPTNNTSPSNMVDVEDDTYDSGGVGDSNLTQIDQHVDTNSSDDRVALMLYDWRDRLIALKQGALLSGGVPDPSGETDSAHRLITFYNLDNLGEAIGTYTYAGDGVSLTDFANWIPSPLTDGSDLRGYTANLYDDLGRVYQSSQYSVDENVGTIGPALTTNEFYDHRGNVIAQSNPGGQVTKHQYDGAGRDVKDSTTDGGVMSGAAQNWTNAGTTINDVVLEQTLNSYDGDGNLIETVDRQRFDNDPTSAVGDLAGPSGGNLASRDYYTGNYYDAADRLTDSANVGTNGGTAWTRPSSVPADSATVLVTHTDYNDAGLVQDTVDPRGIKAGTFYDMLGRQTETIAAWDGTQNPTAGNSTNQITDYTYDGNNDVLTMTAVQPSGGATPNQTTAYVYGVGGTIGTNLFSNDVIGTIEYPDKTTGDAATVASEQQSFGYNWQGDKTSFTDQNGTTHSYVLDVLDRLTGDVVTTLGSGVDGSVRYLGYTFDSAGRPQYQKSYSNTLGPQGTNNVVNVNHDDYNGFGQLISVIQNDSTTNGQILYNYTDATDPYGQYVNNSNLTSVTYPNGREVGYLYGGTSPISSLSYSSGSNTVTATTTTPLGLGVGSQITIQGAQSSGYDGTFAIISTPTPTTFTYTPTTAPTTTPDTDPDMTAIGSPQIPILKITFSGTTATATTGIPLGLATNSVFQVTISGVTNSTLYDGTFNATVTGSNTFTYTMSGTPSGNGNGLDMTAVNPMQVTLSSLTYGGTGGTTATGTSSTALGLATGTQFELSISGASPSTYDGTFTATVTGSTTFTYTLPSNPGTNASGTIIAGLNLPTLDGTIGRVTGMQDEFNGSTPGANNTAILATYQYLGLNTIVQENRPQPGIDLTYIQQPNDTLYGSDSGDRYTGLDRFGRIIDQFWTNVNAPASPTDRFQYGYDQDSNVLYKNNLVNSTFSELYHANSSVSGDNSSAYDSLNRLQAFRRGTLSASGNNGTGGLDTVTTLNTLAGSSNSWNYDALGNQTSTQNGNQTRQFNAQNQITSISGLTTPTYDNNGNMTKDQAGHTYTYDAWNRMVTSSVNSEVFSYTADGALFTDATTVSGHATTVYLFHTPLGDQTLADEAISGSTHTFDTYVWGLGYIDDLITRDRGSLGSATRLYVQQDANHNVTALVNTSGSVVERFVYDPYGSVTVLNSSWSTTTDGQNWIYYFQGGRYDANIGTYYFRNRWYNPATGTWMQEDPTGTQYIDGADLYAFLGSDPTAFEDPTGLAIWPERPEWWKNFYKNSRFKDLGKDPKNCKPCDCACLRQSLSQNLLAVATRAIDRLYYDESDPNHEDIIKTAMARIAAAVARIKAECSPPGGGGPKAPSPAPRPLPVLTPPKYPWYTGGGYPWWAGGGRRWTNIINGVSNVAGGVGVTITLGFVAPVAPGVPVAAPFAG